LSTQLTVIIQSQPELCARLEELRRDWRPWSIIHQDIKWDNVIVAPHANSARVAGLKLVDWEEAGPGDPCWDVGSFLSEYLIFWLSTAALSNDSQAQPPSNSADRRLRSVQLAAGAFWQAYVRRLGLEPEDASRWLIRAVAFAAGRLLQTAFETTQTSAQLSGVVVLELQLAANILQRPFEAAVRLFGFVPDAGAAC
jgi:thiamine kinase-like enzyme